MNIHPLNKIKLAGTIIGVLIVGIVIGTNDTVVVRANANDNVHGYLFSDMPTPSDQIPNPTNVFGGRGLGYVSLNNTAPDPVLPGSYGVSFDEATGKFSGYGWSEYGDYVDFAPKGTTPSGPGTTSGPAHVNVTCLETSGPCSVLGWIKYTQVGMYNLGGWDGWVSLHGTTSSGSTYGVTYDPVTGAFSGAAWGSDVVGWLSFDKAFVEIIQDGDVCTDPTALNYTAPPLGPNEVSNPDVCQYPVPVCTDPTATNYTAPPLGAGQVNDSSVCTYDGDVCANIPGNQQKVPFGYTPVGNNCYIDLCRNIPGVQQTLPVQYQTQWYDDPDADKACTITVPPIFGCTNPNAINYNDMATIDDGSCQFENCTDPALCPTKPINPIYKEN